MGTRSTIARLNADNSVTAIYCHWDGYIHNNGAILKDHYTDPVKIDHLMALADLSSLRPEIGEKQNFDRPTNEDWCVAYNRDRNESDVAAKTYDNVQMWLDNGQEYNYLWDGTEWLVSGYVTDSKLRSLVQVILEGERDEVEDED
jgi:hypothetical protein